MAVDNSFLDRKREESAIEAGVILEETLRIAVVDAMETVHPTYIVGALEAVKLELQVALFQASDEDED